MSSFISSDSSSPYAPSDSEVSCDDDLHDNENSDDDATLPTDDNPSNDWKQTTATRPFSFTGNEHLVVQPVPSEADEMVAPTDVYILFVTDDVLSNIIDESNRYAEQVLENQTVTRKSLLSEWAPTNIDEISKFFSS